MKVWDKMIGCGLLALSGMAALVTGKLWFRAWWDWAWVPTPPLHRFILRGPGTGYHTILDEMILLSFVVWVLLGLCAWGTMRRRHIGGLG